jgi:hypothetical protein
VAHFFVLQERDVVEDDVNILGCLPVVEAIVPVDPQIDYLNNSGKDGAYDDASFALEPFLDDDQNVEHIGAVGNGDFYSLHWNESLALHCLHEDYHGKDEQY